MVSAWGACDLFPEISSSLGVLRGDFIVVTYILFLHVFSARQGKAPVGCLPHHSNAGTPTQ